MPPVNTYPKITKSMYLIPQHFQPTWLAAIRKKAPQHSKKLIKHALSEVVSPGPRTVFGLLFLGCNQHLARTFLSRQVDYFECSFVAFPHFMSWLKNSQRVFSAARYPLLPSKCIKT